MTGDRASRGLVGLCAVILVLMALSLGQSVITPMVFALFVIALVDSA